ncbi:hypothetical protein [Dactylosporangium sp. CA-092794]
MESTYPSAPGDTLVFEDHPVRVWSMTRRPGETNGRGTFVDGNCGAQA